MALVSRFRSCLLRSLIASCLAVGALAPAAAQDLLVEGVVLSGGRPVGGALVSLHSVVHPPRPPEPPSSVSARDGSFGLRPPHPGIWEIRVSHDGDPPRLARFEITAGSVRLTAVDLASTAPNPAWELAAAPFTDSTGRAGDGPGWSFEDSRGRPVPHARLFAFDGRWAVLLADGRLTAGPRPGPAADPSPSKPSSRVEVTPAPVARITGRLTDATTGEPLPGLPVWLHPWSPGAAGFSQADGTFELVYLRRENTPPAEVVAAGGEYRPAREALRDGSGAALALAPRRLAKGLVVDAYDRPVVGARVRMSEEGTTEATTITDDDGSFYVSNPAPGRYDLLVRAANHAPMTVPGVDLPDRDGVFDLGMLALETGSHVTGRVTDDTGSPISGARVSATTAVEPWAVAQSRGAVDGATRTDDDGGFSVADLGTGLPVRLRVEMDGFEPFESRPLRLPRTDPLEIALRPIATVSGLLVDEGGLTVGGGRVTAEPAGGAPGEGVSALAGEDGRFELRGVATGSLTVAGSAPGYRETRLNEVEIEPGQTLAGLELVLTRGVTLGGRVVTGDDLPVAAATVLLTGGTDADSGFGRTGADGRFRFEGLTPGSYVVEATGPGGRRARREVTVRSDGDEITVRLADGVAVGGSVLAVDGGPVNAARVLLLPTDGASAGRETRTDHAGRFRWNGVSPGAFYLSVEAAGFGPTLVGPLEIGDRPPDDLELRLEPGVTLAGQVLGLPFDALPATRVEILAPGGTRIARLDHGGGFLVRDLPASEVTVRVVAAERGAQRYRVDLTGAAPGGTVPVELFVD